MQYTVRYIYCGLHFTAGLFDLLDMANEHAAHLKALPGCSTVCVEAVSK